METFNSTKMKSLITISLLLFSGLILGAQSRIVVDTEHKFIYNLKNGLFDGEYKSLYKNGKTKAEGKFKDNMRIGIWKVYDSTGILKIQREYQNNFEFTRTFPKLPKEGPAKLLSAPIYTLKYNSDGYIGYSYLKERMVMTDKRIWRFLNHNGDHDLLNPKNYFLVLYLNLTGLAGEGKLTAYSAKDDEFRTKLDPDQIDSLRGTSVEQFAGFKIKEDWFFDMDRMISETRIVGICPVIKDLKTGDKKDVCWFYFPETRKTLAKVKIQDWTVPAYIKTVDDLFFFRYFSAEIYKESNLHDRSISDYCKGEEIKKEAERIELNIFELEHDTWLGFSR